MIKRLKHAVPYGIVFAAYLGIIVSFLPPASAYLRSHIVSAGKTDVNGTLWYQWFTKECFLKGDLASLYHTDIIAHPTGKNLLFDLGPPVIPAFSIPFQIALGLPAYYNVFMIVLMALNGLACFALLRYIHRDHLAAFLGSLFFSINPYIFYQVNSGRPEQAAIFWIPLFILFLLKMRDEKRTLHGLLAALLLTIAFCSYWFYGIFLVIVAVLFLLYFLFIEKSDSGWTAKKTALLLCVSGMLMLLLFFYPVLIEGVRPSGFRPPEAFPAFNVIEVPRHPMPLHHPRLPSHFLTPDYFKYMVSNTSLNLLPPLFLIATGIVLIVSLLNTKALKHTPFYIITAGFFLLLSFGPYLTVFDLPVALPYIALYYAVPFFSRLWWPVNCFSVVLVCAVILTAGLIRRMRLKFTSARIILPVIIALAYLLPFYNKPFAFSKFEKPREVYHYLRDQPDCAILELPFSGAGMDFLRNQPVHGKKVFDSPGYPIKEILWPGKQLDYLRANALLSYIDLLISSDQAAGALGGRDVLTDLPFKTALRELYQSGFRFIVINPDYLDEYGSGERLYADFKKILREPYREYTDGVILYKIEELIQAGGKED